MKRYFVFIMVLALLFQGNSLFAEGFWGPDPEEEPSVISYGMAGFGLGAILGLSAGYLSYLDKDESKHLATGPAYGAIIGTGLGITIGMFDAGKKRTGTGGIILRDMRMGSTLGLAVGTAVGVIRAVDKSEWEDLGKGAAWGSLIGAGCGLLFGIYEGPKIVRSSAAPDLKFMLAMSFQGPCLSLQGRF